MRNYTHCNFVSQIKPLASAVIFSTEALARRSRNRRKTYEDRTEGNEGNKGHEDSKPRACLRWLLFQLRDGSSVRKLHARRRPFDGLCCGLFQRFLASSATAQPGFRVVSPAF